MTVIIGRRDFIAVFGGAAASWSLPARAQQATVPVVGFLHGGSATVFADQAAAYHDGLREAGYVEGQNVAIEYRWAEGRFDRLPALAEELVSRRVNVIAAIGGDIVARAAMKATSVVPIVFMVGQDVIRSNLVASLNRPGGNVTGVTLFVPVLVPKQMEILHAIVPQARVIAVLANPNNMSVLPDPEDLEKAAHANGMDPLLLKAGTAEEIDAAFAAMSDQNAGALLVPGDIYFTNRRDQIVSSAAQRSIPTIFPFRESVAAGGLISYGNSLNETARLAGAFTARILHGEKPSDLPVQEPTKFELVINLKTVKALGLTVPQSLLVAADEVIE